MESKSSSGVVFGQSVAAGTELNKGSTVTLKVSKGTKPYAVGDYVSFDGGRMYTSPGGSYVVKDGSNVNGEFIITDLAYSYGGVNYYGLRFQNAPTNNRFGWVAENLIHQRTN